MFSVLFHICYFLFLFKNLNTSELISSNPILISKNPYPIVFSSDEIKYNIITSEKILIIEKSTRATHELKIPKYTPPCFVFKDKKNNYFLLGGNKYYPLKIDQNSEITELVNEKGQKIDFMNLNLLIEPDCIGYIEETKYSPSYSKINGVTCEIEYEDEIIIYAKFKNSIFFFYHKLDRLYITIIENIEEHISCKFVESSKYVCSFTSENRIQIP